MVVVDGHDYVFSSSSNYHPTTVHHRRFPSIPTIKEIPNRGAFNPTYHKQNAFQSSTKNEDVLLEGRAPTIVSTLISPTGSRRNSIKRKKRFMVNSKELKTQFFYPVKAPRRRRSRRGKFRNSVELDNSLNYINIDSSMSKDLCLNQTVRAYEISNTELLKLEPSLKETTKAITIDSNNNYIIYTPNPTLGKNSIISDAEQLLDQELLKLGTPITYNKAITPVLPEYKIDRPYFNRYDTYPITERPQLLRSKSLPSKFKQDGVHGMWNLYLRRVIAARILWRLQHVKPDAAMRRTSITSSVETGFFMNALLKNNAMLPTQLKSDNEDSSSDEVEEPMTDDDQVENIITEENASVHSRNSQRSRESTQEVLGSLESLLNEMRSIIQ